MNNNYPLIYKLRDDNTTDYTALTNKPTINTVSVTGDLSSSDLGIANATDVGTLTDLTTTTQSSVVAAVNEINGKFPVAIADGGTGGTTATEVRTNLGVMTGVQLYYNASGSTGTITLSDNVKNYSIIDVSFVVPVLSNEWYTTNRIYNGNLESFYTPLTINIAGVRNPTTTNDPRVNCFAANTSFSGTAITRSGYSHRAYITNNVATIVEATSSETPKIYNVVGYKY